VSNNPFAGVQHDNHRGGDAAEELQRQQTVPFVLHSSELAPVTPRGVKGNG
jgi:hypothetical protein